MLKKKLKYYFILTTFLFFTISSNTILGQSIDQIVNSLENSSNIIAPKSILIKTTSKDELDSVFAYHFNGLYANSNSLMKIKKIVDKNTIYNDSYYCTKDQKHQVRNLFSNKCEICRSAVQFRPYIKYEFNHEATNYRGQKYQQYRISYSFIPEKDIFIASIEENTEEGINGAYKKEITYVSFNPLKGPLKMEVIDDHKNAIIDYESNSFTTNLNKLYDSISNIKNSKIDSVLKLKLKKKDRETSYESIEDEHRSTLKKIEKDLEKEYMSKLGLYKLFDTKYAVRIIESIPGDVIKITYTKNYYNNPGINDIYKNGYRYQIALDDGNYSFSLDGGNLKYNPNTIFGLSNNVITRKNYSPEPSSYPLVYDYIYTDNDKSNDYLLGLAFERKTSKYIKRYKTSNGGFRDVSDEDPALSRNIIDDAIGPVVEAFYVDEKHHQLYILSKFGHPVFKVPGGFYKNIKSIGNNEFEVTNVQSGQKIKLVLSNNAKSTYDIIKKG